MRFVTKDKIDTFVAGLKKEASAVQAIATNKANKEAKKVLKNGQVVIWSNDT